MAKIWERIKQTKCPSYKDFSLSISHYIDAVWSSSPAFWHLSVLAFAKPLRCFECLRLNRQHRYSIVSSGHSNDFDSSGCFWFRFFAFLICVLPEFSCLLQRIFVLRPSYRCSSVWSSFTLIKHVILLEINAVNVVTCCVFSEVDMYMYMYILCSLFVYISVQGLSFYAWGLVNIRPV